MGSSLIYRSALLYEFVMLVLYGRHYLSRYRAIAELIPAGSSVLDLCCGPGSLYERFLRHKQVDYTGLDINPRFIERLGRRGGRGQVWDLHSAEPLPSRDYVIMQGSLYHFLPDATPIVNRMLQAAQVEAIIAEPIHNLATSDLALLAGLASRQTNAGLGAQPRRFNEQTLDELFRSLAITPSQTFLIPGGREKVYILDPTRRNTIATTA